MSFCSMITTALRAGVEKVSLEYSMPPSYSQSAMSVSPKILDTRGPYNLFAICAARSLVAPRYLRFVMDIENVSSVLRSLHRTMGCCRCCFRKGDWDRPSCVHACKYGGEGEVTAFIVFCNYKY